MNITELEQASPGDYFYDVRDQLKNHVYRRSEEAFAAGDAARDAVRTPEQIRTRQAFIRDRLLQGIGGLPPVDTPLNAGVVGQVAGDGFTVEKIIFESRPRHFVTANLYLPANAAAPAPAVLFLCGHHRQAKHQPEYQEVCRRLVRRGLIVLAQDPIGQGERFSYVDPEHPAGKISCGTAEHDHAGAQCLPLGDGLARYFLHDAVRGIDYLLTRPEVDPARIGVTGNSGGGTQTSLVMMADPRIAAAAPATFVMNRRAYLAAGGAQDAEQIWPGFSAAGLDHEDILLAMAPRPVRVLAVTGDFFPIEGTRRTVQRCRRIWELLGRPGDCDLVEDQSTHCFTPRLAEAAADFFGTAFSLPQVSGWEDQGDPRPVETVPPEQLWCTRSGQVRGEIAGAEFAFEANQARLEDLEAARRAVPEQQRRDRALRWLRDTICGTRQPCDLNPRFYHTCGFGELQVEMALWWSQEGIFNHAYLFSDRQAGSGSLPTTLAIWDGGTACLAPHMDWIRGAVQSGRAVLVLDVSGDGAISPRPISAVPADALYGTIHKLSTDLLWLGDSLPALRTWDVLRALDLLTEWPGLNPNDIQVYAHGRHGLYGRLAAALDHRIKGVEVTDGHLSFRDWVSDREYDSRDIYSVVLYGALRFFDLPDL